MDFTFNLDVRVIALGIAALIGCVLVVCRTAIYAIDEARKSLRYLCGEDEPKQS